MSGRTTCRVLGIDVRQIADRQAISQHDAVTAEQELTDAGLVEHWARGIPKTSHAVLGRLAEAGKLHHAE